MAVHGQLQILRGGAKLQRNHRGLKQFRNVGPNHVDAEHAVGLGIRNDFDRADCRFQRLGAAIGGKRRAPPEDCGGAEAFMARRDEIPLLAEKSFDDICDDLERNDSKAIQGRHDDFRELPERHSLNEFERAAIKVGGPKRG